MLDYSIMESTLTRYVCENFSQISNHIIYNVIVGVFRKFLLLLSSESSGTAFERSPDMEDVDFMKALVHY